MMDIATLGIKVDSRPVKDAGKDLQGLAKTGGDTESKLMRSSASMNKAFADIGKAAALAGVAVGAAFATMTKRSIDAADAIGKLSTRTGIATEELSAYQHLASLSDISNQELADSFKYLAKGITGNNEAFAKMGIQLKDVNGKAKDTNTVFREVADKFASYKDGAEKANLAMEIFGRSGSNMITMLNEGAAGLDSARQEAERLGLVLSKETTDAAAQFNDNLERSKLVLTGFSNAIMQEALPSLVRLSEEFVLGIKNSDGFFDALMKYGLTNPFKSAEAQLRGIVQELEQVDFRLSNGRSKDEEADRKKLRSLEQQYAYYKGIMALQGGQAPKTTPTGNAPTGGNPNGRTTNTRASSRAAYEALELSAAQEAVISAHKEGLRVTEQMRTPLEKLTDTYASLNNLVGLGTISQETYNRAISAAQAEFDKATGAADAWNDSMAETQSTASNLETALINSFDAAGDAIAKFATGGKVSVGDMVQSMIADFIRLEARMQMMAMYKSVGGLGGLFGKLFGGGSGIDTSFTTGLGSAAGMDYAAMSFDGGGYTGNGYRSGGVDGKGGFPAILHPNETVVDHSKGQSMGATVNIYNAPPGTTTRTSNRNGREFVEVFLAHLAKDDVMSKAMQSTFNLSRTGK
jgi:TP901 family phage tail tape measure protein